jgi:hypothetical protein
LLYHARSNTWLPREPSFHYYVRLVGVQFYENVKK